ncbi:MAG: hypothetical protein IPK26_14460 [Planctomycetes bacterium]|nr:hypothetical protein [Planctomycetota bacterium]
MNLPLFLFLTLPLLAQKVPLASDAGRIVQVLDASAFTAPASSPAVAKARLQALATGLRGWSGVPFGERDDVVALGDRHLVVLGPPELAATLEAVLGKVAANATQPILVQTTICTVSKATYDRVFAELVAPPSNDPTAQPLGIVTGMGLMAGLDRLEGVDRLTCPQVVTLPLQEATIATGEQITYVKDVAVNQVDGKPVAAPIHDKLWDGIEVNVNCMLLDADKVGLRLGLTVKRVERPLATFRTTLAGIAEPVEIQLPRVDGVEARAKAFVPLDGTLVMAAPKADGSWVVTLTTVSLAK